jgi:hypothetical protein
LETSFFNAYYQYEHLVKFVQTAYFHLVNAGTWEGGGGGGCTHR